MASNVMNVAYNEINAMYGMSALSGPSNKNDAHKKSELRNTYNSIVKSNKDTPLYKILDGGNAKQFAIDIKAQAHNLRNVVSSLSENGEGIESAFDKRIASSSDESVVIAEYVGDESNDTPAQSSFKLEVKQLATPQENMGNMLKRAGKNFKPGSYSFDLNTTATSYEFQFNVNDDDTNEEVLNKIRKLVNNANIGLNAELVSDQKNLSKALKLSSKQTGLGDGEDYLFNVTPGEDQESKQAMKLLGIDNISSPAENSSFLLNGVQRNSYSNTFTVNNTFSITLNGVSEPGTSATVGFKPSTTAVADNIEKLIAAYNGIINTANQYSGTQESSSKLLKEVSASARSFKNDLSGIGLEINDDSSISIDRDKLERSISSEGAENTFKTLNRFRDSLGKKADQASINPMNYVNKIMVEYKNPGHTFATPYISSLYSGMMVDRFL